MLIVWMKLGYLNHGSEFKEKICLEALERWSVSYIAIPMLLAGLSQLWQFGESLCDGKLTTNC